MIGIKCLRLTLVKPRVAQPHQVGAPRMGIFAKLIGKTSAPPPKRVDHAVLVNFDYIGSTDLTLLFALETKLEAAIDAAKVGEFDDQ